MAFATCPTTAVFPTIYGLDNSTAAWPFDEANVIIKSLDFSLHEPIVVAGGFLKWTTSGTAEMISDTTFDWCEGLECQSQPSLNVSLSSFKKGLFHFYNTDNYADRKYYLLTSERNLEVS